MSESFEVLYARALEASRRGRPLPKDMLDEILLMMIKKHGEDAISLEIHRVAVMQGMQDKGPKDKAIVHEAWEIVPGTYSYYDTISRLSRVAEQHKVGVLA